MKKLIPSFLKPFLITLYILFRVALKGRASKGIKINLSGVLPSPSSGEIVHGGKVKLLALRERFGDSWQNFNIAYFVSSGLPYAPNIWMRIYKAFGVKIVWNQNGVAYPALYPQEVVRRVNGLMTPIHQSDYVIYQTDFTKRCADLFLGEFKGKYSILINPVDINLFKPREVDLPTQPLVVVMMGNHFESKERMSVAIEALSMLREKGIKLKLLVVGRSNWNFTEDWIEESGSYLQKDAPELFRRGHIFLHLKYLDPCPTAVLEALATGMPVIGSNSGGMPELVDNTSGVLIPVSEDFNKLHYPTSHEVSEALLKIMGNLNEFRKNARAFAVKRYDKNIWLDRHNTIFNSLLK